MENPSASQSPADLESPSEIEAVASAVAKAPTSTRAKKRRKPGYNSNKARDERKEELIFLRQTVADMAAQLRALQAATARSNRARVGVQALCEAPAPLCLPPASTSTTSSSPWAQVAARQYDERRRAEMERIRLALLLESQAKEARQLVDKMEKRCNGRAFAAIHGVQKRQRVHLPMAADADAAVFRRLMGGLDGALADLERDFQANGLATMVGPYQDARIIRDEAYGGDAIEVFESVVMTFGLEETAKATWEYMERSSARSSPDAALTQPKVTLKLRCCCFITHCCSRCARCIGQDVAIPSDMIPESFLLHLDGTHNNKASLHDRRVIRRFVEHDRLVIAWRAHCESIEVLGEPMDGIQLLERGYTVVKSAREEQGEAHALVQTCYIMRLEVDDGVAEKERKLRLITESMLDAVPYAISSSHQSIENALLDRVLHG